MSIPDPAKFEKLASFYLGRLYDLAEGKQLDPLLNYDAKDLCTHAMCVGMTGSGKTGLCLSLLEEAALDGIPAICIDPKGDLANLKLAFPDLKPSDFKPWLDSAEATRRGIEIDQYAADTATMWRKGLAQWGQGAERIQKYKDAVDVSIYTPGSNIGLPLTVLKSFDAPPEDALNDSEAFGERVTAAVSGLLTLLDIDADPLTSPEHILLSSIISHQWRNGSDVTLANLIRLIQTPPIKRIGVVNMDAFMSSQDRTKLSMRLNNLLASPAFASWLEGESLSIDKLLYTEDNKPRISILSIAHLNDSERMFFVTILLNELVAWMRRQSGTSSLRALFYMDEVAGYFPPVSNPPSKPPMLTLLKQARAYGLGITLATQNPVDLDYKGLSNIGTWFLGRLQTERDKARVLEGLEGAAVQTGQSFDRSEMAQTLAGLGNRVFLMNNVHEDVPVTFQTRWAMSFLAGPLARNQINDLTKEDRARADEKATASSESTTKEQHVPDRPIVPAGIQEYFLPTTRGLPADGRMVYRPALLGRGTLHFVRSSADLDQWRDTVRLLRCGTGVPDQLWQASVALSPQSEFNERPESQFEFADLPDDLRGKGLFRTFQSKLKEFLYRNCSMELYKCPPLKGYAPGGASKAEAERHFQQLMRERRDLKTEKLRDRYEAKIKSVEKKIRTAEDRVAREESQYDQAKLSSLLSVGSSLLGAFLGRKRSGVMTAARGVGRASQQKDDIRRAEIALEKLHDDIEELEQELDQEIEELAKECDIDKIDLHTTELPPRKSDLKTQEVAIVWTPWHVDDAGIASPMFDHEPN